MQTTQPITLAMTLALGLVCTGAFAAQPQPMNRSMPALQSNQIASDTDHIVVSQIHKVYDFSYLDRNHNGQLSRAELPLDMHSLRREFLRADFNKNGQISPREYLLYAQGLTPLHLPNVYIYATGSEISAIAKAETHR